MIWGIVIFIIFFVCYLGQCVASGMKSERGWILQWGSWLVASSVILVVYLLTQS